MTNDRFLLVFNDLFTLSVDSDSVMNQRFTLSSGAGILMMFEL